ncbi:hypothetical protein CRYUN_Cryun08bG0079300 [Craigia yunnanensis]
MLKLGCKPHLVTFSTLIKGFCMELKVGQAARLFNEMVLTGYQPDLYIYTIIVNGLCKIGDSSGGLRMLREMEERGFWPDIVAYSAVIDCLCQWNEVTRLFNEMESKNLKPNAVTYNILVDGLCKEGKISEALAVVEMMSHRGLQPNVITYSELINGYRLRNEMDEARKVFDSMVNHGCEPNVFSYNIMINGYCKTNRIDEAVKLFHEMTQKGPIPDTVTYTTLMSGMFQAMQNSELEPYIVHYNILIDGMIEAGHLEAARKLFSHIFVTGLKPSLPSFNRMIKGLCDGLPEKAYDLFSKMEEDDCLPNNISYNITIRGFLQSNDRSRAMKILHEMVKQGFSADACTAIMLVDLLSINEEDEPTYEISQAL